MQDHASKTKGFFWTAAACLLGLTFALGLAPLAKAIPWRWEVHLANVVEFPVQPCPRSGQAEAALQNLTKRLYPLDTGDTAHPITVQPVEDKTVNAFATLGGRIYINSGLLAAAKSPEELAGVLAHEMAHVRRRHIMQGALNRLFTAQGINLIFGGQPDAAQWAGFFLNMDFTRSQEAQADTDGLKRLQQAHIDNHGFHDFFTRMEDGGPLSGFLSDHPTSASRMAAVERFENKDTAPVLTPEEWKSLRSYCKASPAKTAH